MTGRPRAASVMPRSTYTMETSNESSYAVDDSIHRAEYFSNAVLEDTYNQAVSSRGKDVELLRNANATIHPSRARSHAPDMFGRYSSRPGIDYRASSMITNRSFIDSTPSPRSLLSSKISEFLRSPSVQPHSASTYPSLYSPVSYRSYSTEPTLYEPLRFRGSSVYPSRGTFSSMRYGSMPRYWDKGDEGEGEEEEDRASRIYKKYHISRAPKAIGYTSHYDEDDTSFYGEYVSTRPYDSSYIKLSSYDGPYDGSYEADMAEMYDYVPFGPSRQGILELQSFDDTTYDTNKISDRKSYRRASSPSVTLLPYKTNDSLTKTAAIDTLVSDTAKQARSVLQESNVLNKYNNASLVVSVEGSALAEDGNRYNFKYYPPPVPLKGGTIGLDERVLGISPTVNTPADTFVNDYLNRLRNLHRDGQSDNSVLSRSQTSYSHKTIDIPLNIAGRQTRVPVSTYRSQLGDGQSHQVDVFPLVESEETVPSRVSLSAHTGTDGPAKKLTVLDKINIKAAIIGSRMESEDGERRYRRPRTMYAANKHRELLMSDIERKY